MKTLYYVHDSTAFARDDREPLSEGVIVSLASGDYKVLSVRVLPAAGDEPEEQRVWLTPFLSRRDLSCDPCVRGHHNFCEARQVAEDDFIECTCQEAGHKPDKEEFISPEEGNEDHQRT